MTECIVPTVRFGGGIILRDFLGSGSSRNLKEILTIKLLIAFQGFFCFKIEATVWGRHDNVPDRKSVV